MFRRFWCPLHRPLIVNGTDKPDETSFRALRPKTLRLTLDVTETLSCYSQSARTRYLAICSTTVCVRQRRGRGSVRYRFGGRFEDRRALCVLPKRRCDFRISTELPRVVNRPRPGPPTWDLRPRPPRRRRTRRCRGLARGLCIYIQIQQAQRSGSGLCFRPSLVTLPTYPVYPVLSMQHSEALRSNQMATPRCRPVTPPHLHCKQATMSRSSTSSGNFMLYLFSHSSSKTNRWVVTLNIK